MQKLDLRNSIKSIIELTKSQQIVDNFNSNSQNTNTQLLLNLLIESKTGFDRESTNSDKQKIFNEFGANDYYKSDFFGIIVNYISANNLKSYNQYLRNSKHIADFFSFHNTLLVTFKLIDNLLLTQKELFEKEGNFNLESLTNRGILVLQVVSDSSVYLNQLSKITFHLDKLSNSVKEFVSKVQEKEFDMHSEIILLDSGSDLNISIKLSPEISQSISKILDDAWEFVTNRTGYKLKKTNKNLRTALSIIEQIDEAEKKSKIGREEAEIWRKQITDSASEIIINNTITKQKALEYTEVSNRKMLIENSKYFLEEGEKDE